MLGLDDVVVVAQIGKIADAVELNVLAILVDKGNYQRIVVDTIVQQHVALVRLSNVERDVDKTVVECETRIVEQQFDVVIDRLYIVGQTLFIP